MGRTSGKKTKENIVFKSFILFGQKPYDQVTFADIEKATSISRGAILYHFGSKKDIFNAVVELSLSSRISMFEIETGNEEPLKNYIQRFVKKCKDAMKEMEKNDVKNINLAYYNIENEAIFFYDNYCSLVKQMRDTEIKMWKQIIVKSQSVNEIDKKTSPTLLARLFSNAYYGHAYFAAKTENGCDTADLLEEFLCLYEMTKLPKS